MGNRPIPHKIVAKIIRVAAVRNLSLLHVEERAGWWSGRIYSWKKSGKEPTADDIIQAARVLGVTVECLKSDADYSPADDRNWSLPAPPSAN